MNNVHIWNESLHCQLYVTTSSPPMIYCCRFHLVSWKSEIYSKPTCVNEHLPGCRNLQTGSVNATIKDCCQVHSTKYTLNFPNIIPPYCHFFSHIPRPTLLGNMWISFLIITSPSHISRVSTWNESTQPFFQNHTAHMHHTVMMIVIVVIIITPMLSNMYHSHNAIFCYTYSSILSHIHVNTT